MKAIIAVVVCLVIAGSVGFWVVKRHHAPPNPTPAVSQATSVTPPETAPAESRPAAKATKKARFGSAETPEANAVSTSPVTAAANEPPVSEETKQIRLAVDRLVSAKTSFQDKYTAWTKLRDEGKLPQVVAELEQRATNNPTSAEYPAALGQAYLHKIAVTKDTRDYAVLGALADRSFDTALDLDPANWEARFFKATAMSYWPEEMNKRPEVIERFTKLIQDQEAQSPQPEFAQAYYWLGETYQKAGRADYADQVWRRGAALFPNDPMLQQKPAARK